MSSDLKRKKIGTEGLRFLVLSILVIAFFVGIVLVYYRMVYEERRNRFFLNGEMSAKKVADSVENYLTR